MRRQLPRLIPSVTSLMSSALAAPRLADVFVALADAAFESRDNYLGMMTLSLFMRSTQPPPLSGTGNN